MRIIVTGLIAQHPALGGMTWHYLHYLLGLDRLGHDVYYFEDSGEWPYRLDGAASPESWVDWRANHSIDYLGSTLARFGFAEKWAYHLATDGRWYGLTTDARQHVVASSELLLNVSGSLVRPERYRDVPRLVYIDTDPTFTQARLLLDDGYEAFQKRVAAHDVHFTFGENLEHLPNPTPYRWIATRQPVVLDEWATTTPPGDSFTTIMSLTSFKPLVAAGQILGQKDMEFQRFMDIPNRAKGAAFEVAYSGVEHENWRSGSGVSREALAKYGWRSVDATRACGDLDSYRRYIQASQAEWSVAKNGYVVGQSGWFSDRSACYLAAGRPTIVQETGFSKRLPVGEGILSFHTAEEASAAVFEVQSHYPRHADAARDIAHEYFDSRHVLTTLVDKAFVQR
jgi:hypothetical protein